MSDIDSEFYWLVGTFQTILPQLVNPKYCIILAAHCAVNSCAAFTLSFAFANINYTSHFNAVEDW